MRKHARTGKRVAKKNPVSRRHFYVAVRPNGAARRGLGVRQNPSDTPVITYKGDCWTTKFPVADESKEAQALNRWGYYKRADGRWESCAYWRAKKARKWMTTEAIFMLEEGRNRYGHDEPVIVWDQKLGAFRVNNLGDLGSATLEELIEHQWTIDKGEDDRYRVYTRAVASALKLERFMDDSATSRIRRLEQNLIESQSMSADCGPYPVPQGLSYFPHQCAGIKFLLERERALLGDDQGTGKTIQVCGLINSDPKIRNIVLVCENCMKLKWAAEMNKWLVRKPTVHIANAGTTIPRTANVVIVNYEKLAERKRVIGEDESGERIFEVRSDSLTGSEVLDNIMERSWDLLVCDESQALKNYFAKRTIAVVGGNVPKMDPATGKQAKGEDDKPLYEYRPGLVSRCRRLVFASGTPVENRPVEFWTTLSTLAPDVFNDYESFALRYCGARVSRLGIGMDIKGATNQEELAAVLRSTVMIRRLKKDVLTDLPPKMRQAIPIPYESLSSRLQQENEEALGAASVKDIMESAAKLAEEAEAKGEESDFEAIMEKLAKGHAARFKDISRILAEISHEKAPYVAEIVESVLENKQKVVVMAHHTASADIIADYLTKLFKKQGNGDRVVIHRGGMSPAAKNKAVDDFQGDPKVRVFIGSIKASGKGITLTVADTTVFADVSWAPTAVLQAEDRTHRIGSEGHQQCTYIFPVVEKSLDKYQVDTMLWKLENVVRPIMDVEVTTESLRGKPDKPKPEVTEADKMPGVSPDGVPQNVAAPKPLPENEIIPLEKALERLMEAMGPSEEPKLLPPTKEGDEIQLNLDLIEEDSLQYRTLLSFEKRPGMLVGEANYVPEGKSRTYRIVYPVKVAGENVAALIFSQNGGPEKVIAHERVSGAATPADIDVAFYALVGAAVQAEGQRIEASPQMAAEGQAWAEYWQTIWDTDLPEFEGKGFELRDRPYIDIDEWLNKGHGDALFRRFGKRWTLSVTKAAPVKAKPAKPGAKGKRGKGRQAA